MKAILLSAGLIIASTGATFGQTRKMNNSFIGNWGGLHVAMTVTASGADLEFDCATAKIAKKIVTKNGRFVTTAAYTREAFGPTRDGAGPLPVAIVITGRISRGAMTITVRRKSNNENYGTFKLKKDAEPELFKCR